MADLCRWERKECLNGFSVAVICIEFLCVLGGICLPEKPSCLRRQFVYYEDNYCG